MRGVEPEIRQADAKRLKELINLERDPKLARRLNAIRLLMLGYSQKEVAKIAGVSRQIVLIWVRKWNQGGKEALVSKSGGSKSKVTGEMRAEITSVTKVKIQTKQGIVTGKFIHGYLKKSTT